MMKDHFLRRKWNTPTQQVDYQRSGGRYARATNYRRVVVRTLQPRPVAHTWALPAFSFGSFASYPLLIVGLVVCGALAVAVTVGLALLPLYLPSKSASVPSVTASRQETNYTTAVNDSLPTGNLTDDERVKLLALLKKNLSPSALSNGDIALGTAEIVWDNSTINSAGQPIAKKVLVYSVIYTARNPTLISNLQNSVQAVIQQAVTSFVQAVFDIIILRITTTTTTTTTVTTTPTTATLVTLTTLSTTTPSTLPTNILSSTTALPPGRRRRGADLQQSTLPSLVTYQD